MAIHYTVPLVEAGIEPSVGSTGDSYDNALAEIIIGLYKTEVIQPSLLAGTDWQHPTSRVGKAYYQQITEPGITA